MWSSFSLSFYLLLWTAHKLVIFIMSSPPLESLVGGNVIWFSIFVKVCNDTSFVNSEYPDGSYRLSLYIPKWKLQEGCLIIIVYTYLQWLPHASWFSIVEFSKVWDVCLLQYQLHSREGQSKNDLVDLLLGRVTSQENQLPSTTAVDCSWFYVTKTFQVICSLGSWGTSNSEMLDFFCSWARRFITLNNRWKY